MKRKSLLVALPIVVLVLGFLVNEVLLGGAHAVNLKMDTISGAVDQALQTPSDSTYIPIEGKDYTVKNTKYFDNGQWAVVSITPINNFSDSAIIVFQKKGSSYQKVLGPGNSFTTSDLSSLPADLAKYLNPQGNAQ